MNALKGAITALASSYFVAILFAYAFRVPIPLAGYYGPFGEFSTYSMAVVDVFKSVLVAWAFYGVFGGFFILPVIGSITGVMVGRKYYGSKNKSVMIALWSVLASVMPVLALSVLDYMVGPW